MMARGRDGQSSLASLARDKGVVVTQYKNHRFRAQADPQGRQGRGRAWWVASLIVIGVLGGGVGPGGGAVAMDWLPVAEVEAGMTGYGLTVFRGSAVDTFGVTVLGVQRGVRAGGDVIIIEVAGHGLELSAVPQGMSGSPVYIAGRFAGAVAFGWGGALLPIAGVTPADEIMALPTATVAFGDETRQEADAVPADHFATERDKDAAAVSAGTPVPAATQAATFSPLPLTALVTEPCPVALQAAVLDLDRSTITSSTTTTFSGATADRLLAGWPSPAEVLAALLPAGPEPALAGGAAFSAPTWIYRPLTRAKAPIVLSSGGEGGTEAAWPPLQPGSAGAVSLILGDAQLGALGTVTWLEGDRVVMMGHPFMQRGPVALPLSAAEIITIFPSRSMSFKMGSIGPAVGTVLYDQRAGLVGKLGPVPELVPVAVSIDRGATSETYAFSVVEDPVLTPSLVFWCLYNALLVSGDDQSRQTLRYEVTTLWSGEDETTTLPIVLSGQVAGPGGAVALQSEWMAPIQILLNNRHESLRLREVRADLRVSRPLEAAVVAAAVLPGTVPAGETLAVAVTLETFRGQTRSVELSLPIPEYLTPGRYRVVVANARDLFALEAERAAGLFRDRSLPALIDLIRRPRSASTLVAAVVALRAGVVVEGRELADLPGSVGRLLRAGRDGQSSPTRAGYAARVSQETDLFLQGHAVSELTVLPSARPTEKKERP